MRAGHEQKRIDRDHDAIQTVVLVSHPHQHELQRREQEEHPKQRAVVAGPGGRHRNELPQGPKRNQAEQHHRDHVSQQEGGRQHREQNPPRPDAKPERFQDGGVDAAVRTPLQDLDDPPGDEQQHQHRADQTTAFVCRSR